MDMIQDEYVGTDMFTSANLHGILRKVDGFINTEEIISGTRTMKEEELCLTGLTHFLGMI